MMADEPYDRAISPILRAQIIQTMAVTYVNAMKGSPEPFDLDDGMEAARATWDTEWDNDPAPRTIEAGIEAVNQDLQYWNEE
jgi:hypothetical protein